jgi:long-chain acyl-CoA synthetase
VFGVPDPKWGESVAAAVVASAPVEPDELLELCRAHIASFKKPTRIEFVDALPKNAYGKILRRELRQQFAADATSGSDPVVAS